MSSEAAKKLAKTIRSGFRTSHNCVLDEIADKLAAQIVAAIREELLTDRTLVLHAEEILELQTKVEALENDKDIEVLTGRIKALEVSTHRHGATE